ncbi:MAG: zinc-dependent peptidase [Planctomycetes bacterium]|nr:zinc-dependent peptidase [Planctomycetota bacterium]
MFFSWWRNRRRSNLLAEPFPDAWQAVLDDGVGHYQLLNEADQKKLRDAVVIMLSEKDWEGCRGLELTDEIRVTIAALAAVLIIGLEDFYFDNVQTVLIYPDEYVVQQERPIEGGVVLEEESDRLGEAHYRGPVIVSWQEIRENARQPGSGTNLVFHEFAHQLDMLNGEPDGTPDLPTDELAQRWTVIMDKEFRRLQKAEQRGQHTVLDPYGANDTAEFFAVSVECFFDSPRIMQRTYPDLYQLFCDYFRQDPASWPVFEPEGY